MEIDGTSIFWLLTLGLVVGGIMKLILGNDRGMGITMNIIGGVLSTLIVGMLTIKLDVPGSLLLGLMGAMAVLFLANIFYLEDEEPVHDVEQKSI